MTAEIPATTEIPATAETPAAAETLATAEDLLPDFIEMLVTVMGEDLLLAVDITEQTSFEADLGIESIELVALSEQLRLRYGNAVDVMAFFAERGLDELMNLTVGDFLEHIAASLARRPAPLTSA
jgi:acyl carrier protein